jgi:hypothetical protein
MKLDKEAEQIIKKIALSIFLCTLLIAYTVTTEKDKTMSEKQPPVTISHETFMTLSNATEIAAKGLNTFKLNLAKELEKMAESELGNGGCDGITYARHAARAEAYRKVVTML